MKKFSKTKNLITVFTTIFALTSFVFLPVQSKADYDISKDLSSTSTQNSISRNSPGNIVQHIMNKTFYIKNAYSGRYLDVYRGNASDGANVQQCSFNGGNNQKWYINYNGDGTFTFLSQINTNFALDVYGANSGNYANINLWTNHGGDSEKFKIYYTDNSVYKIASKISNYERCLVVENRSCSDEGNVMQHDYNKSWNDLWILEPVSIDVDLGAKYAVDNYNQTVSAYPRCSADCTNFASQCLLASGFHYQNDWQIYRKNDKYNTDINKNDQLKYSWDTSVPGPWLSAPNFKNYWGARISNIYQAKGSDIVNNPSLAWNLPISQGCIIQMAKSNFGSVADPHHTMYVTGYLNDGTNNTYLLTYHSSDTLSKSLLDICRANPDEYFLFLKMI
jgi:hypothetical protein